MENMVVPPPPLTASPFDPHGNALYHNLLQPAYKSLISLACNNLTHEVVLIKITSEFYGGTEPGTWLI